MIGFLARLSRSIPLVIALVVLAIIIYLVVTRIHSSARAKEVLIKAFTVLCSVLAIVFALISIYAVVDENMAVFELTASFALVGALGLIITRICNYFFKKHNPQYKWSAQKARIENNNQDLSRRIFWTIYDFLGKFRPKK